MASMSPPSRTDTATEQSTRLSHIDPTDSAFPSPGAHRGAAGVGGWPVTWTSLVADLQQTVTHLTQALQQRETDRAAMQKQVDSLKAELAALQPHNLSLHHTITAATASPSAAAGSHRPPLHPTRAVADDDTTAITTHYHHPPPPGTAPIGGGPSGSTSHPPPHPAPPGADGASFAGMPGSSGNSFGGSEGSGVTLAIPAMDRGAIVKSPEGPNGHPCRVAVAGTVRSRRGSDASSGESPSGGAGNAASPSRGAASTRSVGGPPEWKYASSKAGPRSEIDEGPYILHLETEVKRLNSILAMLEKDNSRSGAERQVIILNRRIADYDTSLGKMAHTLAVKDQELVAMRQRHADLAETLKRQGVEMSRSTATMHNGSSSSSSFEPGGVASPTHLSATRPSRSNAAPTAAPANSLLLRKGSTSTRQSFS